MKLSSPNFSYISRNGTLSSSNIKKIPHIFSKERFFYISENGTLHFSAQALKIKETIPGNGNPKNLLVFSKKKAFLIFQETETLKNFRKAKALKKRLILHEVKSNFLASGL